MKLVAWVREHWSWSHPGWALVLAMWFTVSDIRLTPISDTGDIASVGPEAFLMMSLGAGVCLGIIVAGLAKLGPRASIVSLVVGPVIGVAAVVVSGLFLDTMYNSYDLPTARYMVLPILGAAVLAAGVLLYVLGRPHAEMVLLTGGATMALAPYGQELPLWYFALAAVAGAVVLLWPRVSDFTRITTMVLYMLALLMFLQLRAEWFTWISFPFLLLAPLFLVALYFRAEGRAQRVAWWTGAVMSVGSAILGITTGIAAILKSLPVVDPLVMLGIGAAFSTLFILLAVRHGSEAVGFNMPSLAQG